MSDDATTLVPTIADVRDLLRDLPTPATSEVDRELAAIEADD